MIGVLDPVLLRTLLVVAEEASFTRASERLGLTPQAVSHQIKRLESIAGRRLAERRNQDVRVTADGEALIVYAKILSETTERVRRQFSPVPLRGSVRLGVLEGFASTGLAAVLAALRQTQPELEVFVETAETDTLMSRMENERLDIVFGGQRPGQGRGEPLLTSKLQWYGDVQPYADPGKPVRLALYPEPSLPRAIAIESLVRAGRPYAVVFESNSRTGLQVAAIAGIGVAVFGTFFEADDVVKEVNTLPDLGGVEFFLRAIKSKSTAVDAVAELIKQSAKTLATRNRRDDDA